MSRDGESYLVNMRGRFLNLTEIPSFILKRFWMWADFKVPSQVHELYPPAAGVLRAAAPLPLARPHCCRSSLLLLALTARRPPFPRPLILQVLAPARLPPPTFLPPLKGGGGALLRCQRWMVLPLRLLQARFTRSQAPRCPPRALP